MSDNPTLLWGLSANEDRPIPFRMNGLTVMQVLLREGLALRRTGRRPEPSLVMDASENVAAYTRAGSDVGVMAPTHLFHSANIAEIVSPGDTVVDLGCGPGRQLVQAAALVPDADFIGIDLSENMLQEARANAAAAKLSNVTFQLADITKLNAFPDQSVDVITSVMTLHHLPDLAGLYATFQEIARVLRPGGGIYIADFARRRAEHTMHLFAHDHENIQSAFFTEDYYNSLKAAFTVADFREAMAPLQDAHLYRMAPVAHMIAIRTPARYGFSDEILRDVMYLRSQLTAVGEGDLRGMLTTFRIGGLKPAYLQQIQTPKLTP